MRKPMKVAAIRGEHRPDVVRDEDLEIVSELQAEAWKAEKRAQRATEQLRARISHGARVEAKRYRWDAELGMVRSRKERAG